MSHDIRTAATAVARVLSVFNWLLIDDITFMLVSSNCRAWPRGLATFDHVFDRLGIDAAEFTDRETVIEYPLRAK